MSRYSNTTSAAPMPRPISAPCTTGFMRATLSPIDEKRLALSAPGFLVGRRLRVEIGGGRLRIVDPLAQQLAAVDQIDRQAVALVFVREVAPQGIVGPQLAQRLERRR